MGRLKELRLYLKMTQSQMANILGIKQNSYSQVENGKASITDRNKSILSQKYHVSPEWLSGEDVDMFIKGDAVAGIIKHSFSENNKELIERQIIDELVDKRLNDIPDSKEERLLGMIESQQRIIESQQRTIEAMQEQFKKMLVQMGGGDATCANASGCELGK